MNKTLLALVIVASTAAIVGCNEPATQEQKIAKQMASVYALTADERSMATTNSKAYFEKQWITAKGERGQHNSCRPSDSNHNGLVSCFGFVPQPAGGYKEIKMYCGYRPELVGCSDEDTVK